MKLTKIKSNDMGASAKKSYVQSEQLNSIRKNLTVYQPLCVAANVGVGLVSLFQDNYLLAAVSFGAAIGFGYLINKSAKQVKEIFGDNGYSK